MRQYTKSIRGKLFKYFEQSLGIKKSTKGWWRCNCPHCGGHHTLGIHLEQSRTHCFICESKMTPVELLMKIERFETYTEVRNFLNIQQEFDAYEEFTKSKVLERKEVILPESFKLISKRSKSILGQSAYKYITHEKKRNLDYNYARMAGVGYCDDGKYAGYIIFPFHEKGRLTFFQGRAFIQQGTKMKNPDEEEFGIGKSQIIYNVDALFMFKEVDIVESIINAITLGEQAIAILGKSISSYQFYQILNSPVEKLNIILDPDATDKAIQLALSLCHFKKVRVVILPDEEDVNSIGKKKTLILKRAQSFKNYTELFKMKLDYEASTVHTHN